MTYSDFTLERALREFDLDPVEADLFQGLDECPISEVRRQVGRRIGLFSGTAFDVDPDPGLGGWIDFVLTRSPLQVILRAPVCVIVEAKNDNIKGGLGQCIATMVAAQLSNERAGEGPSIIYGAVTTGSLWRFLRLADLSVTYDRTEYLVDQPGKIVAAPVRGVGELSTPIAA